MQYTGIIYIMKNAAKLKAESLRHQGRSIKEIARKVGVSQSTASRWCFDITLSPDQLEKLEEDRKKAGMQALAPWILRNRRMKNDDIKKQGMYGRKDLAHMTKRDLFMIGLGLYWGEGYKRGSQECGFTNSDPEMIRIILVWFNKCYGVSIENVIARLTINLRYKNQAEKLAEMWSQETSIPLSKFGKPTFINGYNSSKLNERTYRGTLRIKVRRGTSLRRRILASVAEVSNQISFNSRKTDS
jgi:hypothetical protein